MKLGVTKLSSAVSLALSLGAVIAAGASGTVFAQDSSAAPATDATSQPAKKTTSLDTVVVTGSNIRRVDLETSNPVQVIDRAAIQASGKVTLGDLIQEIPSVSGDATNPRVNNGGGAGSSTVSLRGLGSARTLILVNGKRVVNNDVNAIPASMVERIEVLKDGASAVYGSDAIGGVVNFILRSDYQGAQISTNFGQSDRADGDTSGYTATFGTSSDKGNIVAGIDYNKTDEISSAARNFSKNATYFSSGSVYNGGSSRTPGGYLQLPAGSGLNGCAGNGNGNATLAGTQPGKVTAANYRCYTGADGYNYQAENLIETPQERTNVFALANYNFSDNVQGYFDAFYNKTSSQYALAPLPFDAQTDGVTISPNSYYNPYPGTTFGPGANEYKTRLTTLGQRVTTYSTTTAQAIAGLKGNFGTDSSWQWNADIDYGHVSQSKESLGQLYLNGLQSSGAFGPSFLDPGTGVVTCGTAQAPIANCTPINIFNVNDPKTIAALKAYAANAFYNETYISKRYEAGANGNLFSLPAGEVSLAVGVDYDKEYQNNSVDYIATTTGAAGTCFISQSACSTPLAGGYNYKEAYAELFVPILADVPFVKSLNVTVGGRYSDYSLAGSTTNYKFAVEWRPFSDLLLRGTMEGVFRAPTVADLYAGGAGSAPQVNDPCIGYTGGHAAACANVPTNGTFVQQGSQTTSVVSGSQVAGYDLKPEYGKSFDFGAVYDPSWLPGASASVDLYRVQLNDTITPLGAQTVLTSCYNNASSPFCAFIHRNSDGTINYINSPTVNLGELNTKGVDGSFKYKIPHFDVFGQNYGDLTFSLDTTYLIRYDNDTAPGTAGDVVEHLAGLYSNNSAYGNFARWRGLGTLTWTDGPWDATWRTQYIGTVRIGSPDISQGFSAEGGVPGAVLNFGPQIYHNVSIGYNLAAYHTRFDFGVNNLFDTQPPLMYQNNVLNSNTDVNTYDTIGRYFWGRITVTF